jgi:hypothetical protein
VQLTQYALDLALTDLTETGRVFSPTDVWLGIATAITNNGLNTLITDITPAPGTLAPLQEVTTWGPVYAAKNGLDVVDGPIMRFSPTTSADAATIVGWYIMDAATAGNLLGFGFLPLAVTLNGPENILSIVLRLSLDPAGTWDVSMTWDD